MSAVVNHSWPEVRIGDVLTHLDQRVDLDDSAEYITITVKRRHGGLEERERLLGHQISTKKQFRLAPGAFIISRVQCWHEAYAIVPDNVPANMIASQNYDQFVISPKVDKRFFWWLSHSPYFTETVRNSAFGVVIEKMVFNRDAWLEKKIPLPPLDEQQRIVSRIDELSAKIDQAWALRRESAEEVGALAGSAANKLFQNFARRSIETIADVRGGIQKGPHRVPGANPVRYLTVTHVQRNQILTTNPRFFEVTAEELQRWRLLSGDVLIIEGNGSADQIGRTALFKGEIENCVHQNHVIRIRPNNRLVQSEFLNAFLNSPAGQEAVQSQSRTTSGLRTLSVGRIKQILVPVPPLPEQRRIVTALGQLQAEVDKLKRLQSETGAELDALMPSILDKAFRGEL